MVATAGVGAAVVGYTGYMIGTELYLNTVLPDGVAIPQNTAELAKLVWTEAGKPAPAAVMAPDATDEQKALTWAIENQLISADKAADASVSRWEVIQTWNKAQEMKGKDILRTTSQSPAAIAYGLRLPASASCKVLHARPAGRCPNNSSLLPPLAAVVVVALLGEVALRKQ